MPPRSHKPALPDPAQFTFSPLFPHSRPNVSPEEISKALGITGQQVRDLIESNVFARVPIGDNPNALRKHVRVLRCTVEAWWLEKYFGEHGEEFPWPNPHEVTVWRQLLRSRPSTINHGLPGSGQPSTS